MRDYAETAKKARYCASEGGDCHGCPSDGYEPCSIGAVLNDAADAIEELKFENEILNDGIDDLKAEVKRLEEVRAQVPPSLWTDEPIEGSEFMTHNQGGRGFEIHFRTDSAEKYKAVQDECRRQIGHAKPEPPKEENKR